MGIDISQFLVTFYEESFEGLDTMESELLSLNPGAADSESINTIFRAAHSIKGGSGTFGLTSVAEFTHVLETLLDEMRDGRRQITQVAVDLMLSSVDVLRGMLTSLRDSTDLDAEQITRIHDELEALLKGESPASVSESEPVAEVDDEVTGNSSGVWHIFFKPFSNLFKTGNDPVRIIRELGELGELNTVVDISHLPEFDLLDPEECFLAWNMTLKGDITEAQIRDVFSWVEDDCELVIESCNAAPAPEVYEAPVVSAAVAEPNVNKAPKAAPAAAENIVEVKSEAAVIPVVNKSVDDAVAAAASAQKKSGASSEGNSIRVGIDKVDALINMVGELVITQSMLNQLGEDFSMDRVQRLQEGLAELERHTRELQENVMRIRMLPISFSFNRFPRLVHDLSSKLGKKIELKVSGENTELDKTVMEKIGDPMVHLVRNSLDHGIELPADRIRKGKPEAGVLHLNAYHQGGNIVIEIKDDGAGLNSEKILKKAIEKGLVKEGEELTDSQIHELIFQPGFSTADQVSDVSGRGVGMDVVKRNIKDLGGVVEIVSVPDVGSTFTIRLPLTLAILDGQLVRLGTETYIIPLVSIIESLQITQNNVNSIAGGGELYKLRDEYLPIVRLHEVFNMKPDNTDLAGGLLVVVEGDGQTAGIFVDDLLGQQQVVIKSLESNFKKVEGLSGATILGDGTVALILDVPGLVKLSKERPERSGKKRAAVA